MRVGRGSFAGVFFLRRVALDLHTGCALFVFKNEHRETGLAGESIVPLK